MKQISLKIVVFVILSLSLCTVPAMAAEPSSGQVVTVALNQMGYTEGSGETTKFGKHFGYPNGYWCDMFVSWCAEQTGMSKSAFPRSISCTKHYQLFSALGRYEKSAFRGGTYTPRQGDLVLFRKPDTGVIHHVGFVLYVEDGKVFTIEGNAVTVRWDYPADEVSEARVHETEPYDYVTCNIYPIEDPRLHGYAVPGYSSREPLQLEGFVDLGQYSSAAETINTVAASGLMKGTSSHTFSPRAGMARGEFLQTVLNLCGFTGWLDGTPEFDDVPPDHPYYGSVMTARSAGLIPEGENLFHPDLWISGEDAQFILSALLNQLGAKDRTFTFTDGDLSPILTPYTTRGDIAQALYVFRQDAPVVTEAFEGHLTLRGEELDWPVRTLDGVCYVPVLPLMEAFPELLVSGTPVPSRGETEAVSETQSPEGWRVPDEGKAILRNLTLEAGEEAVSTRGFLWNGTVYAPVGEVAQLLGVSLETVQAA